jgi:hypothetical protein
MIAPTTHDRLDALDLDAVLGLDHVADEDQALEAGAGPLVGGWVRVRYGRVLLVHSDLPRLSAVGRVRGSCNSRRAIYPSEGIVPPPEFLYNTPKRQRLGRYEWTNSNGCEQRRA